MGHGSMTIYSGAGVGWIVEVGRRTVYGDAAVAWGSLVREEGQRLGPLVGVLGRGLCGGTEGRQERRRGCIVRGPGR